MAMFETLARVMTDPRATLKIHCDACLHQVIWGRQKAFNRLGADSTPYDIRRGKVHEMPVHHRLLEHLDAYLAAIGPLDVKAPLFRSAFGRTGKLGDHRLNRHDAYAMVRRRAISAGVAEKIGNHSFRGTGITTYLENDGTLELAQEMANHASPRTTKLYDRRGDKITQDAVERIRIE